MKDTELLRKMQKLIAEEDPKNPLTDQELSEQLGIARSNLTALRQENHIHNSRDRRRELLFHDVDEITRLHPDASARYLTAELNRLGYRITLNSVLGYLNERKPDAAPPLPYAPETPPAPTAAGKEDAFSKIVGCRGSLAHQIDQAKAAVLYPPHGLHTLIIGESGVGKSMLAEAMYNFLESVNKARGKRPFVEFNCADYAENPQLLAAQLFGYVSGAFTGAVGNRDGLIAAANGGIIFLDEIHRMPPDGQEMLFQLIDRGTYRSLGDKQLKQANVLIIGATTENIQVNLLNTFRRRIPMVISLPSLAERDIYEKYDLIALFFRIEAARIHRDIRVEKDVLRCLLSMTYAGNIGELRSKIQVACARAYLNYVLEKETSAAIRVTAKSLFAADAATEDFQKGAQAVSWMVAEDVLFSENGEDSPSVFHLKDPYEFSDEIYRSIESQYEKLQNYSISSQDVNTTLCELVEKKIARYLGYLKAQKQPALQHGSNVEKIVDPRITDMVKDMLLIAKTELGVNDEALLFLLSTHLNSAFQRIENGSYVRNPYLQEIQTQHPREFETACHMARCSVEHLGITLPNEEIAFIALYLAARESDIPEEDPSIGLIVVTHGNVAVEMVKVAEELMGAVGIVAVNIDLAEETHQSYKRLKQAVIDNDRGRGVIILTDMGSPENFGARITEETGIVTRTVTRVDTLMVLDAVRKVCLPVMDIDDVVLSLSQEKGSVITSGQRKNAFVVYCLTGDGCAAYLRDWLSGKLEAAGVRDAEIVQLGALYVDDIQKQLHRMQKHYRILGIAGTFKVGQTGIPQLLFSQLQNEQAVNSFLRQAEFRAENRDTFASPPAKLTHLFRAENILFHVPAKTKDDAIRLLSAAMERSGNVTAHFSESTLAREELGTTFIYTRAAIPHGSCADVLSSGIGVLLPEEPVDWGDGMKARVIFLLAFTEESTEIFSKVSHIVMDEKNIDEITSCASSKDVLTCLWNYI